MALTCCVVLPWGLFVILISYGAMEGVPSLNHCGGDEGDNYAELIAGKANIQFTCSGIDGLTVNWRVGGYSAGRCPPPKGSGNSCDYGDVILGNILSSTRTSSAESKVHINGKKNLDPLKDGKLVCQGSSDTESQGDSCDIDIITPAEGTCSAEYDTSRQPWTVKVNCDITKADSSRGRYQCLFYQTFEDEQRTKLADWTDMVWGSNTPGRIATCSTTSRLNANKEGRYKYSVKLKPGRSVIDAAFKGNNEIKRPAKPQIGCEPTGYVPENTNLTCSCNTTDTGLPAGRLRWTEHRCGCSPTILDMGRPGEKSLVLSKRLQSADHDVKQFRCDVVWAEDVLGENYTAKVGSAEPDTEPSSASNVLSVSGWAVAGTLVLVAIIGGIVFAVRRKRGPNAVQNNTRQGRDVSAVAQHQEGNLNVQYANSGPNAVQNNARQGRDASAVAHHQEGTLNVQYANSGAEAAYIDMTQTAKENQRAKKTPTRERDVEDPAIQDEHQYTYII